MIVDTYYYGKMVVASINIILYNVFSPHGPNLYGTEPFSYYFLNLFLNFNIIFLLSLISIPVWLFLKNRPETKGQLFIIISLHIWYLIFFKQSHKEERFMYPIYPLISLTSSFTLTNIEMITTNISLPFIKTFNRLFVKSVLLLFFLLSLSRTLALYKGISFFFFVTIF